MPFIPHTPESLLRRSDSKNPATTCKGITTSGSHCRRSITLSPTPIPHFPRNKSNSTKDGVLAVLDAGNGPSDEGAAAFFCWQHKDQAMTLTNANHGGRKANIVDLKRRTSLDTLAERLGLLDIEDHGSGRSRRETKKQRTRERAVRKETLPKQWQDVDGPLMAVHSKRGEKYAQPKRKKEPSLFAALCCVGSPDADPLPPTRIRKFDEKVSGTGPATEEIENRSQPSRWATQDISHKQQQTLAKQAPSSPKQVHHSISTPPMGSHRPRLSADSSSQTQNLLSFIPKTLSLQTMSLLLAELAKPVSPHDEAGYIYIFWLTPSSTSSPDDDIASSLLIDDNAGPTTLRGREKSQVISTHATDEKTKTLLLKIGRAANVQRRMNQWTRQCGYDLSLIRFYPYLPSTKVPSPLPSPRGKIPPPLPPGPVKVPHAHKVERMVHMELADKRVKQSCEACGKEHKEWFEVQGTREGLRDVDGVVRRWVGWAHTGMINAM